MSTTRMLSSGLVLATVSLSTFGGAMAQDRTIAFSPLSLDIPAMQGLSGALNHFADEAGIGYMALDPKFDATTQAQQLAQVIETGRVNGAWAITIGAPALRNVVQRAVESGIPMVVSGRPGDYGLSERQPGIAFSDIDYEDYGTTIGRELGNCIVEKLEGEGKVFFLGDTSGAEAAKITDDFGKAGLENAAPNAVIIAENLSLERLESQQKVSQMLLAHGDANAVYASNDENAMGALQAFEAAGLPTPCIVSGGGSDEVLGFVESGKIYAAAGFDFEGDAHQNFQTLLAMMDSPTELGPILSIPIWEEHMNNSAILDAPPGTTTPYVVKAGQGRSVVVAGQVVRILAGVGETASGYGAVMLESSIDKRPIPMHFHEKEHDIWLCTRGRLQIWNNDQCRVLAEGDFAYVQPGDVHSYQCVAPRTQFFGIVAPGGWEGFFDDAGEAWTAAALPEPTHPYDFSRMGPAMGKHGVNRVEKDYCAPSNGDATDRVLPEGPASYILQSGYGTRYRLNGHLATTMLSMAITKGAVEMRSIEAGRGAVMPSLRHAKTHLSLFVLNGTLKLTLNGVVHKPSDGDFANIPAGTAYGTEVTSGHARWVYSAANGDGLDYWTTAGEPTESFAFDGQVLGNGGQALAVASGADVEVAG